MLRRLSLIGVEKNQSWMRKRGWNLCRIELKKSKRKEKPYVERCEAFFVFGKQFVNSIWHPSQNAFLTEAEQDLRSSPV
jgi:hypothetical protein